MNNLVCARGFNRIEFELKIKLTLSHNPLPDGFLFLSHICSLFYSSIFSTMYSMLDTNHLMLANPERCCVSPQRVAFLKLYKLARGRFRYYGQNQAERFIYSIGLEVPM